MRSEDGIFNVISNQKLVLSSFSLPNSLPSFPMDILMKRFDRRKRLLAQKRDGAFDPNQYYLERDKNSRALRKIRVLLRKMEPVSLVGTAWDPRTSDVLEMSSTLATGTPEVWMHLANCREIWNWDAENSEKWLLARVADALGLTSVSRGVSQLGSPASKIACGN